MGKGVAKKGWQRSSGKPRGEMKSHQSLCSNAIILDMHSSHRSPSYETSAAEQSIHLCLGRGPLNARDLNLGLVTQIGGGAFG